MLYITYIIVFATMIYFGFFYKEKPKEQNNSNSIPLYEVVVFHRMNVFRTYEEASRFVNAYPPEIRKHLTIKEF